MGNIKDTKDKSRKFYNSWRETSSYSPALKTNIRISLLGWRHLTGASGYKKRTGADIARRLKLLPQAKQIIESSTTVQNISTRRNRKFYAFEAVLSAKKIRVVLIEDKLGNKIFYSVMDKKQKSGTPHA